MNTLQITGDGRAKREDSIYLYCQNNSWRAVGHSAFYLALLFPELEVVEEDVAADTVGFTVCVSDDDLMEIFEAVSISSVSVGDECVEIFVPQKILNKEKEYTQWCTRARA